MDGKLLLTMLSVNLKILQINHLLLKHLQVECLVRGNYILKGKYIMSLIQDNSYLIDFDNEDVIGYIFNDKIILSP
jgi:hypothetical protein